MLKKVYLHDTDALGFVYYSRILEWLEEERMDILASRYKSLPELIASSIMLLPRNVSLTLKRPISLGEELNIETSIDITGRTSISLSHTIEDRVSAIIEMVYFENGKLSRIPDDLKECILKYQSQFS